MSELVKFSVLDLSENFLIHPTGPPTHIAIVLNFLELFPFIASN